MSTQELAGTGVTPAVERDRALARHWTAAGTVALSGVAALALLVWAYRQFIATPWLPLQDESGYYMSAVRIWHALRSAELHALLRATWDNHMSLGGPFLSPYFLALGFIFGANTLEAARTASLIAGFFAWVGIAWLAAELAEEGKAYAAAIAGVLWGTSPMFLYYTSRSLYDSFALVFTAFCLVAVARFARNGGRAAAVAAGFLAFLSFEVKCNVGVVLLAAIFLGLGYPELRARLARDARGFLAPLARPWFLLAASALLPLTAFLMVDGIRQLVRYLRGYAFYPLSVQDQLLYYPRSLFQDYVPVAGLALLFLLGVLYWSWKGWSRPAARVALLYVVLQGAGAGLHTQTDGRFIWGAVAVAASLAGAFLARELSRVPFRIRFAAGGLLAFVLAFSIWAAPASAQAFFSRTQVAPTTAQQAALLQGLNFIRDNTTRQQTLLVAGVADEGINQGMVEQFLMNPVSGQVQDMPLLPYANLPASWGISPQPSPFYADSLKKEFSQAPEARLVILDHEAGSPFRGPLYPWILAWQENYAHAAEGMKELEVAARLDTHAGLRVTIYCRRAGDHR
ncbi:MAG TPA: hypothetical protein VLW54_10130 [Candidatus Acidoferrales bacterium]|nr:hypothetical protein [Candidatus Acidoferrales bacterium]